MIATTTSNSVTVKPWQLFRVFIFVSFTVEIVESLEESLLAKVDLESESNRDATDPTQYYPLAADSCDHSQFQVVPELTKPNLNFAKNKTLSIHRHSCK